MPTAISAAILKQVGYSADDIAGTLKAGELWDKSAKATARILKDAGFTRDVKGALKAAGWSENAVTQAIRDIS